MTAIRLFLIVLLLLALSSNAWAMEQDLQNLHSCNLAPHLAPYTEIPDQKNCAVLRNAKGEYLQVTPGGFPPHLSERNLALFVFNADPERTLFYQITIDGFTNARRVTLTGLPYLVSNLDYPGIFFCVHETHDARFGVVIFGQANRDRYLKTPLPLGRKHCIKDKATWEAARRAPVADKQP